MEQLLWLAQRETAKAKANSYNPLYGLTEQDGFRPQWKTPTLSSMGHCQRELSRKSVRIPVLTHVVPLFGRCVCCQQVDQSRATRAAPGADLRATHTNHLKVQEEKTTALLAVCEEK